MERGGGGFMHSAVNYFFVLLVVKIVFIQGNISSIELNCLSTSTVEATFLPSDTKIQIKDKEHISMA
jgi:hypothetical protein